MSKKHLEEESIIENGEVSTIEEPKTKKSKKEKKDKKDKKSKKDKKERKEVVKAEVEAEVEKATEEVEIEDESELHIQAPKKIISSDLGFISIESQIYLTLAPCYGDNLRQGINEQLNGLIMKFVPQLNGVVLSHSNSKPLQQNGKILFDCPFINFWVNASFLIWRPVIGSTLEGTVSLQSSDHLGLLVFNTFNVSIPASNIPKNKYKWKRNSEDAFTTGEWVSTIDDQPISNNNTITFKILEFSAAFDMLTIGGSLDF